MNLDLAPPKRPPVERRLPGVGSVEPLTPNNSRPGPAVPIRVPVKRRAGPSQRPVPASVSGPHQPDGRSRAEAPPHHDVLLALLRHVLSDG
jgi:hypothetical protein